MILSSLIELVAHAWRTVRERDLKYIHKFYHMGFGGAMKFSVRFSRLDNDFDYNISCFKCVCESD